jgi:hypothetical protein
MVHVTVQLPRLCMVRVMVAAQSVSAWGYRCGWIILALPGGLRSEASDRRSSPSLLQVTSPSRQSQSISPSPRARHMACVMQHHIALGPPQCAPPRRCSASANAALSSGSAGA